MAKLQTFTDTFDGNVINGTLWPTTFGTVSASNSQGVLTVNSGAGNYSGADSPTFDLRESYVQMQLADAGNQALTTFEIYVCQCCADSNNSVSWLLNQNIFICRKKVAGVNTQVGSNLSYDSAVHKYFRIRETNGTTYWDYSPDGVTWTNHTSIANPITLSSVYIELASGTFGTEGSATAAKIDNINIIPTNGIGNQFRRIEVGDGMSRSEGAT
jgi:hypothetical protein